MKRKFIFLVSDFHFGTAGDQGKKKYPFSCFTAVVTYMVWNASIVATNVFTHLMCLNRKVGWRLYNLDLFHKNFNQ